jgi:membrane protein
MRFYGLFDFLPRGSVVRFVTSHFGGQIFTVILLGLAAFFVYMYVPLKPPRKFSAFQGALFCTLAYFCTVMVLGIILNKARYNFLYGTFGNLIIILVNVYFFFTFFFIGAQLAFVVDYFDALLFSRMRKIKIKASKKSRAIGFFKKLRPYYLLNNFFNPSKSNLNKYLRHYKKDEVVFSHGDIVDDIFYLLDGEVEVLISSSHGKETFSGIVKADSFFGEMGNLLSEDRIVTVRAKTDISVFAITSSLLDIIIKHDTSLDRKLIEHMSRRLKRTGEIAS